MPPIRPLPEGVGQALRTRRLARGIELVTPFAVAAAIIAVGRPLIGKDPLHYQLLVWVANLAMLGLVWLGLRLRGQEWSHIGLGAIGKGVRSIAGLVWKSIIVFVCMLAAMTAGAILMANILGRPEPPDTSGYAFLHGNLPLFLVSLAAVLIGSSLGEEILYRGFLITRLIEIQRDSGSARWLAVTISGVVFGLAHFAWGPAGMVQTAFMGLALGVAFLLTKRALWVLVLAHAYGDIILMVQMYLGNGNT